jgi:hypothetical protein
MRVGKGALFARGTHADQVASPDNILIQIQDESYLRRLRPAWANLSLTANGHCGFDLKAPLRCGF